MTKTFHYSPLNNYAACILMASDDPLFASNCYMLPIFHKDIEGSYTKKLR